MWTIEVIQLNSFLLPFFKQFFFNILGQHELTQRPSDKAEFILKELIDQAKDVFSILDEPLVEWDTIEEDRPIAKVIFKWDEMPNLTKKCDTTNLIYLFGTEDTEIGSKENFKSFSEHVDLI